MIFKINAEDYMASGNRGLVRQFRAITQGKMGHDHGGESSRTMSRRLADSILGEIGELAVSRLTGLPITTHYHSSQSVIDWRVGDVDGNIEVKTTEHPNGHLIIHPTTPDQSVCVLVTVNASKLEAKVCGWIKASEAKLEQYFKTYQGEPDSYWIPQHVLQPIEGLPNLIKHNYEQD